MKIWDPESIQFFLLLFVPGFISIKVYDLLIPGERRDFVKTIPEAVSFSALNIAFFFPISLMFSDDLFVKNPGLYVLFLYSVFLLVPIVWPILWIWITKSGFISKFVRNPIPTPWDYVIGKRETFWVIAHLVDGRKIGGVYGHIVTHIF